MRCENFAFEAGQVTDPGQVKEDHLQKYLIGYIAAKEFDNGMKMYTSIDFHQTYKTYILDSYKWVRSLTWGHDLLDPILGNFGMSFSFRVDFSDLHV